MFTLSKQTIKKYIKSSVRVYEDAILKERNHLLIEDYCKIRNKYYFDYYRDKEKRELIHEYLCKEYKVEKSVLGKILRENKKLITELLTDETIEKDALIKWERFKEKLEKESFRAFKKELFEDIKNKNKQLGRCWESIGVFKNSPAAQYKNMIRIIKKLKKGTPSKQDLLCAVTVLYKLSPEERKNELTVYEHLMKMLKAIN